MRLILLGPPGAGKGTQANVLSKKFGWVHISTGDLLREAVANDTNLGREAKTYMQRGELVPDRIVTTMVAEKIKDMPPSQGFVLDGYPRTEAQALDLDAELSALDRAIDMVVYFKTSPEVIIARLSGRRVCKQCGAIYHADNMPPKNKGVCDRCGGALIQRDDDREETVRNRLKVYEQQTKKLLSLYEAKDLLKTVSGDRNVDELFQELSSLFHKE
jgi:adenylate kinase